MKRIKKSTFRKFRKSMGMTQAQMAEYLGVSIHTIRTYEQESKKQQIPLRLSVDPRTKHLAR